MATGDTITINGVVLTGTAGARTSGSDDFSVSGGTTDAIAAEIVAAVNDSANSFSSIVTADSALNVVTFTAVTAGSGGNSITLATTTIPGGNIVMSGATLTGGSAAGSLVGDGVITIEDCELVASGAACYQIRAETVGHIRVRGGTWRGSDNASLSTASNCALFSVAGVEWANDIQVAYDTTEDRPNDTTSEYEIQSVGRVRAVLSNLSGAGSFAVKNCPQLTSLSQDGDQTLAAYSSSLGALTLNGTTAATLQRSTRTTITLAGGTPTLAEPQSRGSETFAASVSQSIAFTVNQPDTNYTVLLESPSTGSVLAVTNKAVSGFDIESAPALTGDVTYSVVRAL